MLESGGKLRSQSTLVEEQHLTLPSSSSPRCCNDQHLSFGVFSIYQGVRNRNSLEEYESKQDLAGLSFLQSINFLAGGLSEPYGRHPNPLKSSSTSCSYPADPNLDLQTKAPTSWPPPRSRRQSLANKRSTISLPYTFLSILSAPQPKVTNLSPRQNLRRPIL